MIVVASKNELGLIDEFNAPVIITGEGAENVVNALQCIPRDVPIVNVGYAGSNCIPVGTKCRVGKVRFYFEKAEIACKEYVLDGDVSCYTSGDFVTQTDIKEPCLFDMELALILAMGFTNVTAIKTVSDNLNKKEYEQCLKK